MQIRELSVSELEEGFLLLSTLRFELGFEQFKTFISTHYPQNYRPIGAYERSDLRIYAGVSVRENLELGRHLVIDDLVAQEGFEHLSAEMIDFLGDYAKMHGCSCLFLWGKQRGIALTDLNGFRPKRDGFLKTL